MDLRLLEYFLRVAELGSINRAAADLRLSQPALSRHIALLEHEMGTALFNRTRSGVTLTSPGELLSERARPLLRQFTILKEQVGEKAVGQLAIGINYGWENVFASTFVAKMSIQHPGIALRIYEGVSNLLLDHMAAGLLDLCIIPASTSPGGGYRQRALAREPLVLVGALNDGLQSDHPVSLSRLHAMRLILPGRSSLLRNQIEQSLESEGLTPRIAVETDGLTLSLDLARRGIGYTVVPASAVYNHGLGDAISWAPLEGQFLTWALYENAARTHSQAVQAGRKMVVQTLSEVLTSGTWLGQPVG
ncbi:LysR family transcriptional regulator [Rhizobium panacihumi]|uniref:LysR family transcriptional regulator n=1 Tax=Rhizobium panacihumi TaxID=2008450 RepID=UPI003D7998B1